MINYHDPDVQEKHLTNFQKLVRWTGDIPDSADSYFECYPMAVFLIDALGRFTFFNRAAEEFIGYTKDEICDKHFRLLLTLDDLSDGFKLFYQVFQESVRQRSLFRVRLKNGLTRVVDLLAAPVFLNGAVKSALCIANDITGRVSQTPRDAKRVEVFKKFSSDLEKWKNHIKDQEDKDNKKSI